MKTLKPDIETTTKIQILTTELLADLKALGFHLLLYKARSSSSTYIKLDCGLCGTIRVSDHAGKRHLKYKWNILTCHKGSPSIHANAYKKRHFYGPAHIAHALEHIKAEKDRLLRYDSPQVYDMKLTALKERIGRDRGFWQYCKEV